MAASCLLVGTLTGTGWSAQVSFLDVTAAAGIDAYEMARGMGGGMAAADFDDDGDIDVFVPTAAGTSDLLYRNLGSGVFEEIADLVGVGSSASHRVALWFHADADSRMDLFVAGDCFLAQAQCPLATTVALYLQQPDGEFVDATAGSGLDDPVLIDRGEHRGGLAAGDLDNDGDLDLYTSLWTGQARLYRNEGDGTFVDISAISGVGLVQFHHQAVFYDFDRDGWLDIYAAIDNTENHLWMNQGDLTFVDVAVAVGAANAWNDMGLSLGDADSDGDIDLYITNIEREGKHNLLLRNDSTPGSVAFTPLATSGTEPGGWGWGTSWLDADNDGDLDLAATNGWLLGSYATDRSRFFRNDDPPALAFTEVSTEVGFDDPFIGTGLVAADFDGDGDPDLLQGCHAELESDHRLRLLENTQVGGGHWLRVRPRMDGANPRAIAAVVRLRLGETRLMRVITAGTSYLSQEPAEALFGLGASDWVDRLEVEWPGGGRSVLGGIAVDATVMVTNDLLLHDGFESGGLAAWGE